VPKPQQPELHRSNLGQTDQDGKDLRAAEADYKAASGSGETGPVPPANQAGHSPEHDQDKPEGPPEG
jgi:hypothetical protein